MNAHNKKKYAVQRIDNGQVIDYVDSPEQASFWIQREEGFEIVPTNTSSVVVVAYTELGGPNGYGHQEEPFKTHGGIVRCIINLYKWVKQEVSVWGPNLWEVKSYFRRCHVTVNGQDETEWFLTQIDKLEIIQHR